MNNKKQAIDAAQAAAEFEDKIYHYSRGRRSNPGAGPSAALVDIVETLNSEHRYIAHLLDDLEQQAQKLVPGKRPDYQVLLDMVDYLAQYPDNFHHPREDILFSELKGSSKSFAHRLERLLEDHQKIHNYNDRLLHELTRITSGKRANRQQLKILLQDYIDDYREHMRFESRQIFPAARGELSEELLLELANKTRFIDDPLFGRDVVERYQNLRRNLQVRLDIIAEDVIEAELSMVESGAGKLAGLAGTALDVADVIGEITRDTLETQLATVRAHFGQDRQKSLLGLPLAMLKNYGRSIERGIREVRDIVEQRDEDAR